MMRCLSCDFKIEDDSIDICPNCCDNQFVKICPKCSSDLIGDSCQVCGYLTDEAAARYSVNGANYPVSIDLDRDKDKKLGEISLINAVIGILALGFPLFPIIAAYYAIKAMMTGDTTLKPKIALVISIFDIVLFIGVCYLYAPIMFN